MDDNLHTPGRRRLTGRRGVLLVTMLMVVMCGCTSPANFQPTLGAEALPPYEGKVKVLENLPASNQFKRVGVVTVEGVLLTKESNMVAAIKETAAEHGANAVVMQSQMKVSKLPDGSTRRKLAAWAIRLNR